MTRNNVAKARYHAVVTRWSKRMSHGYALDVSHTWSRTRDNQTGEGNGFSSAGTLLDNYNVDQEYGISLQDLAHRLVFQLAERHAVLFEKADQVLAWNPAILRTRDSVTAEAA